MRTLLDAPLESSSSCKIKFNLSSTFLTLFLTPRRVTNTVKQLHLVHDTPQLFANQIVQVAQFSLTCPLSLSVSYIHVTINEIESGLMINDEAASSKSPVELCFSVYFRSYFFEKCYFCFAFICLLGSWVMYLVTLIINWVVNATLYSIIFSNSRIHKWQACYSVIGILVNTSVLRNTNMNTFLYAAYFGFSHSCHSFIFAVHYLVFYNY